MSFTNNINNLIHPLKPSDIECLYNREFYLSHYLNDFKSVDVEYIDSYFIVSILLMNDHFKWKQGTSDKERYFINKWNEFTLDGTWLSQILPVVQSNVASLVSSITNEMNVIVSKIKPPYTELWDKSKQEIVFINDTISELKEAYKIPISLIDWNIILSIRYSIYVNMKIINSNVDVHMQQEIIEIDNSLNTMTESYGDCEMINCKFPILQEMPDWVSQKPKNSIVISY
ncbi:MAG: hypothetical protein ACSHXL_07860 [Bacteroidota bacterium]